MSITGTVLPVGFTPSSDTPIPPSDFYAVLYVPQSLTPAQKLQALVNIGAVGAESISSLVADISFDPDTKNLNIQREDGSVFGYDLSNNQGIATIALDTDNNLLVTNLNGTNDIIPVSSLLTDFVKTINGKSGTDIIIGIDEIENLTLELNQRVPTGTTITVDGVELDLQANPEFITNAVTFTEQELTDSQQAIVRDKLDVYSKQEVLDVIETGHVPKQKQIFTHVIGEEDLVNELEIPLTLESEPDITDWYDLHINGGFVNDNNYHFDGAKIIIHRTEIAYPITVGKRITFRYREA